MDCSAVQLSGIGFLRNVESYEKAEFIEALLRLGLNAFGDRQFALAELDSPRSNSVGHVTDVGSSNRPGHDERGKRVKERAHGPKLLRRLSRLIPPMFSIHLSLADNRM
jgi:hypothetical protein